MRLPSIALCAFLAVNAVGASTLARTREGGVDSAVNSQQQGTRSNVLSTETESGDRFKDAKEALEKRKQKKNVIKEANNHPNPAQDMQHHEDRFEEFKKAIECDPHTANPDSESLSCGALKYCMEHKRSTLGGYCVSKVNTMAEAINFPTPSNTVAAGIKSRGGGYSQNEPNEHTDRVRSKPDVWNQQPLEEVTTTLPESTPSSAEIECNPSRTSRDPACAKSEYCHPKPGSGLGGYCMPIRGSQGKTASTSTSTERELRNDHHEPGQFFEKRFERHEELRAEYRNAVESRKKPAPLDANGSSVQRPRGPGKKKYVRDPAARGVDKRLSREDVPQRKSDHVDKLDVIECDPNVPQNSYLVCGDMNYCAMNEDSILGGFCVPIDDENSGASASSRQLREESTASGSNMVATWTGIGISMATVAMSLYFA